MPSITNLATVTALNTKINKVKNKVSNITNLGRTTVENKISNASSLVKKTDYNTRISEP